MVGGDGIFPEPIAKVTRDAFRHPPRVHEHQRRSMLSNQRGEPVVVLLPDLVRHDRFERRAGNLQIEIHRAPMPLVDNRALARTDTHEIPRDLFDRLLRGGQADAQQGLINLKKDCRTQNNCGGDFT